MKSIKSLSLFVITLVIAACGSKETPLTAEQKAELKAVGAATNGAISAPGKTSTASRKGISAFGISQFLNAVESSSSTNAQLASRLESAKCDIQEPDMSSLGTSSTFNFGWNVSGASCPVSMSMKFEGAGSQSSGEVKIDFRYKVNDEEYKKLAKVASVDITGKITGSQSSMNMDIDGAIVTLDHGNVGLKITGTGSSNSGEVHVNISMKDFTAHLKIEVDSSGKKKYELNGEEISESELQAYMN